MKVNFKTENFTERANTFRKMEINMKGILLMGISKELEYLRHQMEMFTKENLWTPCFMERAG